MPARILYEFDGFRLDPVARSLSRDDQPISIRPIAFELLLVLVEHRGQTLTKPEIIKRVWGTANDVDTDNKFHVTLRAVRQALEGSELDDAPKAPRLIVKDANGYRIAATVREVPAEAELNNRVPGPTSIAESASGNERVDLGARDESQLVPGDSSIPTDHRAYILVSCVLYGALYATSIILEIAYEFDRFGGSALRISPLVFGWITITSTVGLVADQKLTLRGRRAGLVVSVLVFFLSALVAFAGITFLPSSSITLAGFQTYPAQTAYLKDMVYFLVLAVVFMILPFHFVSEMEGEIGRRHCRSVLEALTSRGLAVLPGGMIYPRFWALTLVLLLFAVLAIPMTAHLLDNLTTGPYTNLFTQLFYVRGILYFTLGIECLIWYYGALNKLKRTCISRISGGLDHY